MVKKNNSTRKRAATKKTTTTPQVPALKPTAPPRQKKEKATYKLGPQHIQLIIDMTIAGYTNGEILDELKKEYDIKISENTLCYHRRQRSDDLNTSADQQLKAAQARSPYMQLATRIATLSKAIDKEAKKKNPSGYAISMLMAQINTSIKDVQVIKMKTEELARKLNQGKDGQVSGDEYVRDMENRARVIKDAEYVEAQIIGAGAEEELIVRAKIETPAPPPAPMPDPERSDDVISVEDIESGIDLDESALRA
jgi:hypothetical protein